METCTLTYAIRTLHRQHFLTCSSSPHWFSSRRGIPPPRGVLETLRNYMYVPPQCYSPTSQYCWVTLEADKATSVGWKGRWALPALADLRHAVPFWVIIFNDEVERALPAHCWVWLWSKWILSSKVLSWRGSLFRWAVKCTPSAPASLVPLLINSSEGFFPAVWLLLLELYRLSSSGWRGRRISVSEMSAKSTNPPTILQGNRPTCFALGLVTCVYAFAEAVWPFLQMVALWKPEEMTNAFAGANWLPSMPL